MHAQAAAEIRMNGKKVIATKRVRSATPMSFCARIKAIGGTMSKIGRIN